MTQAGSRHAVGLQTPPAAADSRWAQRRPLSSRKCHEPEIDLGAAAMRQLRKPWSGKIDMSRELGPAAAVCLRSHAGWRSLTVCGAGSVSAMRWPSAGSPAPVAAPATRKKVPGRGHVSGWPPPLIDDQMSSNQPERIVTTPPPPPPPDARPLLAGIAGPGKNRTLEQVIREYVKRIRSGRWVVTFVGDAKSVPPG